MIRILTGIIALVFLVSGVSLMVVPAEINPVVIGMLIRVGALMGVIWLAFPQLESLKGRLPTIMIALGVLCLTIVAARPNLGKVVVAIVTIAIGVGAVLKWLTAIANSNHPPRK